MVQVQETWRFAATIASDFKGQAVLQSDVQAYFDLRDDQHDIDIERPATLVIRFSDEAAGQRFSSTFGGTCSRL